MVSIAVIEIKKWKLQCQRQLCHNDIIVFFADSCKENRRLKPHESLFIPGLKPLGFQAPALFCKKLQ
jgi:hypothetical protein